MESDVENLDHLLPPFFLAERDDLIREIYAVFANVTLGEGLTWGESVAMDEYSADHIRQKAAIEAARRAEETRPWQEWTEDPEWVPHYVGMGGFNFLDDEGARFYLPGAMVKTLQEHSGDDLAYFLERGRIHKDSFHETTGLPFFDEAQRRCVRRFLQYMIAASSYLSDDGDVWRPPFFEHW